MSFAAAIFDLDGTLLDTERVAMQAGREVFAAQGIEIGPEVMHRLVGKDDVTSLRLLTGWFPALDAAAFKADWGALFRERLAGGIPLKPGAEEVLAAIGLPKALATSSTRAQAELKLRVTGIGRHFRAVVTFDDVSAPKPAAEPFLRAAMLLGVDPGDCVAFEDSETGAEAARAAGMCVVQVPDIVPTEGAHAHHVAADLFSAARAVGLI